MKGEYHLSRSRIAVWAPCESGITVSHGQCTSGATGVLLTVRIAQRALGGGGVFQLNFEMSLINTAVPRHIC